ncbi:MAG: hypothetical protein AB1758_02595 [Candidatus Eremiobacterota bacterium]
MGSAYVPGLKVNPATELELERRLPLKGQVMVEKGQRVAHDHIVARTELPGNVEMVNVANKLGLEPKEVPQAMFFQVGQSVEKGAIMAQNRGFFGLFKGSLESPITGTVEEISAITGQVLLRRPPVPVEVAAYVDGTVVEIMPDEGVRIKSFGAHLQGIFGIGGETSGELAVLAARPDAQLQPSDLKPEHSGKVVVGGSLVTGPFLKECRKVGVAGVIVGGIHDRDLRDFLGYDLGVAITGSEKLGVTLIITEGFGPIRMAERTWKLLTANAGRRASISGATQIRAGVIRPEVFIPRDPGDAGQAPSGSAAVGLDPGAPVRIIREPHFGALAKVVELPVELTGIPTEARVRVAVLELEDGTRTTVPRANLELIEE